MTTMDDIKNLREKTGAGVMDAKKALEETKGDMKKAEEIIREKGLAKAEKKAGRETKEGVVYAYVHHDGKSGAMVELQCETDFVARSDTFKDLAKELAMQVCSMDPKDVDEFLGQEYIRDPQLTVKDLIASVVGKVGENIVLKRFVRLGLGES